MRLEILVCPPHDPASALGLAHKPLESCRQQRRCRCGPGSFDRFLAGVELASDRLAETTRQGSLAR
jgi:hypothetical protein